MTQVAEEIIAAAEIAALDCAMLENAFSAGFLHGVRWLAQSRSLIGAEDAARNSAAKFIAQIEGAAE